MLQDFGLFQASQCARHIYYLNFNSYDIPGDCPIWGDRVNKLTHSAFCTVKGEEWRQRRGNYYNVWGKREPWLLPDLRYGLSRGTCSTRQNVGTDLRYCETDITRPLVRVRCWASRSNHISVLLIL